MTFQISKRRNHQGKGPGAAHQASKPITNLRPDLVYANSQPYVRKPDIKPAKVGDLTPQDLAELDAGRAKALALEGMSRARIAKELNRPDKWVEKVLDGKRFGDVPAYK